MDVDLAIDTLFSNSLSALVYQPATSNSNQCMLDRRGQIVSEILP
jgi:hypothetical protein